MLFTWNLLCIVKSLALLFCVLGVQDIYVGYRLNVRVQDYYKGYRIRIEGKGTEYRVQDLIKRVSNPLCVQFLSHCLRRRSIEPLLLF